MNSRSLAISILTGLLLALSSPLAQAQDNARGGTDSGGGDMCENRIKIIRDDFLKWLDSGSQKKLKLPKDISTETYTERMKLALGSAKIRCVGKDDPGYPVMYNTTPKTCRFDRFKTSNQITCDIEKFDALPESEQYVLVHHEYAGIARIEIPNDDDSNYDVSNQITDQLEEVTVLRLRVTDPHEGRGPLQMTSPDSATIQYEDRCSNGGNVDETGRKEFMTAMLENPRSRLARLKSQLREKLGDAARGEGVYLAEPIQTFHYRMGCGGSDNSYSYVLMTIEGGNSNFSLPRYIVTIDDNDDHGTRTLKVNSIRPFYPFTGKKREL